MNILSNLNAALICPWNLNQIYTIFWMLSLIWYVQVISNWNQVPEKIMPVTIFHGAIGVLIYCGMWFLKTQALAWCAGYSMDVGNENPALTEHYVGSYHLRKTVNSSSRIHFNWLNRIHFKLILLTFLLIFIFSRQILTSATICYLIYFQ